MTGALREPRRLRHGALRVLWDPVPGPLTAIALVIRAGSRFDGAHPGIAHMAEHMLFQGTRRIDQATLNRRAGDLGGEHDADTGYEDMALHLEVFNQNVPAALELLGEQCFGSTVPSDRFAKERRVVLDEIRGRAEDPGNYLHERAWARFFAGSLAHPVAGSRASVRRMTPDLVRRFIRRHFVPANMVLAVVGGVGEARLRRGVRRAFPRSAAPPVRSPARPRPGVSGLVRLRRDGTPQVHLVRLTDAPTDRRTLLALSMAIEIVGSDPDARLFQEIRERLGLGYDLSVGIEQGHGWATTVLSATAGPDDERRLRDAVERTFRAAADGFAAEELRRARTKVRYRFARLADSRMDRALAHASRIAGGYPSLAHSARTIESLHPAEIDAAWRRLLRARTLTAVLRG